MPALGMFVSKSGLLVGPRERWDDILVSTHRIWGTCSIREHRGRPGLRSLCRAVFQSLKHHPEFLVGEAQAIEPNLEGPQSYGVVPKLCAWGHGNGAGGGMSCDPHSGESQDLNNVQCLTPFLKVQNMVLEYGV